MSISEIFWLAVGVLVVIAILANVRDVRRYWKIRHM
jgi:hypothetical protein